MNSLEAAKNLVARFLKRRKPLPAAEKAPISPHFAETSPPMAVRQDAQALGDVWRMTRILTISIVTNVLLAGLLMGTAKMARDRPQQMVATTGDLRERIRAHFSTTGIRKDNIVFFLQGVLTLKNGITVQGAPFQILLQGLVSTEVYQQSVALVQRNIGSIRSQDMSQSLVIEDVGGIDYDTANKRMSVVVKGEMMIQASRTKSGAPLAIKYPYRALCILDVLPVSDLNPYGYYLVSLREEIGTKEAKAFDLEMEKLHARSRGKN